MNCRLPVLLLVSLVSVVCQNCTYRAWYEGFRERQRQDCYKIANQTERQGCLDRVNAMTYDKYKASLGSSTPVQEN
jgi:hypothetical protein